MESLLKILLTAYGTEYNWTDTGSLFRKDQSVQFNVINKGTEQSVPNSYVLTPFSFLSSSTPSSYYLPRIDLEDLTSEDSFSLERNLQFIKFLKYQKLPMDLFQRSR